MRARVGLPRLVPTVGCSTLGCARAFRGHSAARKSSTGAHVNGPQFAPNSRVLGVHRQAGAASLRAACGRRVPPRAFRGGFPEDEPDRPNHPLHLESGDPDTGDGARRAAVDAAELKQPRIDLPAVGLRYLRDTAPGEVRRIDAGEKRESSRLQLCKRNAVQARPGKDNTLCAQCAAPLWRFRRDRSYTGICLAECSVQHISVHTSTPLPARVTGR